MVLPLESITYNLLALQNSDFKELMRNHLLVLLVALGLPCRLYFDPIPFLSAAVNWNVAEVENFKLGVSVVEESPLSFSTLHKTGRGGK
jgi:hypothetical protein